MGFCVDANEVVFLVAVFDDVFGVVFAGVANPVVVLLVFDEEDIEGDNVCFRADDFEVGDEKNDDSTLVLVEDDDDKFNGGLFFGFDFWDEDNTVFFGEDVEFGTLLVDCNDTLLVAVRVSDLFISDVVVADGAWLVNFGCDVDRGVVSTMKAGLTTSNQSETNCWHTGEKTKAVVLLLLL